MSQLQTQLNWKQYPIKIFGKEMMQPRLVSFAADKDISYTYSQTTLIWNDRPTILIPLKNSIQATYNIDVNSVLCNWYRDGNDSMGRHADDETELWPDPTIVSVSLWATRTFRFRHKKDFTLTHSVVLSDGDILIMDKGCQLNRQHAIPKTTKKIDDRINLTWRLLSE